MPMHAAAADAIDGRTIRTAIAYRGIATVATAKAVDTITSITAVGITSLAWPTIRRSICTLVVNPLLPMPPVCPP